MRELCSRLCLPSIKYSNLRHVCSQIYEKYFQIQSSEIPFEADFRQLMTFDIARSFFSCVVSCASFDSDCFVASPVHLDFLHTRALLRSQCEMFYLPVLVIDCEKLISAKDVQILLPATNFRPVKPDKQYYRQSGGEGKEIVFQQISIENMWKWWFTKHNKLCFMPRLPHSQALPEHLNKKQFFRYIFNSGRISQAFER